MNIIKDTKLRYLEEIRMTLRAYNNSQIGVREHNNYYVYLVEGKTLLGAIQASFGWDYVTYDKVYYQNIDILKALHNEVIKRYKDVTAFQYMSYIQNEVNDFITIGYEVVSSLPDFPKGHQMNFLVLNNLLELPCENYSIITSENELLEYKEIIDIKEQEFFHKYNINNQKVEFNYVALDNDTFLGGIYSYLQYDYIYISLLVVKDEHRSLQLGSKLMKKVEEEALLLGTKNIYVGTASFQALDFYKKLGYKLIITLDNYPKGHQVYTLYKHLNIDK